MVDIVLVGLARVAAVVGVFLHPATRARIAVIDVVAEPLLEAPAQIRLLMHKALILPILLERRRLGHAHRVDQVPVQSVFRRARTDDPVADGGRVAYSRLARCERAVAVERIGGKTEVACHHVGI